jgi:hypothetical protein
VKCIFTRQNVVIYYSCKHPSKNFSVHRIGFSTHGQFDQFCILISMHSFIAGH